MEFWLVAGALALVVNGFLALALVRLRNNGDAESDQDMRIYRDQLSELDRDVLRGILTREEAGRVRIEVSRRLLEADRTAQASRSAVPPRYASFALTLMICVVLLGGSTGIYLAIGAPGYPDLPLADRIQLAEEIHRSRMGQAEAEARIGRTPAATEDVDPTLLNLMERLRATVAMRPDDLEGLSLLARYEALLGNHAAAHSAQSRVIALKGGDAVADDHATLAEQMVLAADGFVSPEAETALTMALRLDGNHGPARYYQGLMLAQSGRPDLAFGIWRTLLETGPPDAPWTAPIMAQIEELAQAAGIRYSTPTSETPPLRGPTTEDIRAADGMSPEDRQDMIRGMVDGLAERIESGEHASPAEWVRLIRSLGVLGQTERVSEFWSRAQEEFAEDPEAMAMIRTAAAGLGVVE